MLHLDAECPSKQNILNADTILTEPGSQPGFKISGGKYIFRRKRYLFSSFVQKKFFWAQQNLVGNKKDFGGN